VRLEVIMNIGILGSAVVAQTLGGKLLELGHAVMISSRDLDAQKPRPSWGIVIPSANEWVAAQREQKRVDAAAGSFADAAAFGELLINATAGAASLDALAAAGEAALNGKILIDLGNPLDYSQAPPTLTVSNTESLAERIQATYPGVKVVKTLNTVSVSVTIDPAQLGEDTTMFVSGNDQQAKEWVRDTVLKGWFGWRHVLDLGDITSARGQEMYLPLWLRLWGALGTGMFNIKVVR
jgi:predicted dinucleotide-binding enzyme